MSKFAFKTLLFLFPLLILLAIIEYKLRSIPNDFEIRRERIEQNIDRAEIIVTGPSHTFYGVKPELLNTHTLNLAYPAQDIYYDTRVLLKYLPQAARVKLVVITVSYISFEYMMEDSMFNPKTNFYKRFLGIPRQSYAPKLADYSYLLLFGLPQSRDFLLTGKVDNMIQNGESGGDAALQKSNDFNVRNSHTTIELHKSVMHEKYFDQNSRSLNELLNKLREKNIQAIIITLPCYPSYYNNINNEKYLRMQNEINILSQKYGAEYYNYFKDERFTVEDFFDSDHLSTRGGEKFTGIFRDEVIAKYFSGS